MWWQNKEFASNIFIILRCDGIILRYDKHALNEMNNDDKCVKPRTCHIHRVANKCNWIAVSRRIYVWIFIVDCVIRRGGCLVFAHDICTHYRCVFCYAIEKYAILF